MTKYIPKDIDQCWKDWLKDIDQRWKDWLKENKEYLQEPSRTPDEECAESTKRAIQQQQAGFTSVLIVDDLTEIDREKYPHICDYCGSPCYKGGDNSLDCTGCSR